MSSNIRIERVCQHCGIDFIAKTTVTQYCGDNCAKKAYKARQKLVKVVASNQQTREIKLKPVEELKAKEFLSITETCQLLGLSRWTVWRAIKSHELAAIKVGRRAIIKRSHLDNLFQQPNPNIPQQKPHIQEPNTNDCYTLSQVKNLYNISEKALHELIKRNSIPKYKKGIFAYVPKNQIDNILNPKA